MNPALDIATATEIVEPSRKLRCEMPRYDPGGGGINARARYICWGATHWRYFRPGSSPLAGAENPTARSAGAAQHRTEVAAAEQVQVEMRHFLVRRRAVIGENAITARN